jgi:hypothetical protein
LRAEVVRDSVLSVSGELDTTMGGPEIPHEKGLSSNRRSLYFAHHGEGKMEWLEIFDAANPCDCYRRTMSVLPQQALALSNSELAIRCGRSLAARLGRECTDDKDFIRAGFEQVLSRAPSPAETAASEAFLRRQREFLAARRSELIATPGGPAVDPAARARENFVQALLNHNDFIMVR